MQRGGALQNNDEKEEQLRDLWQRGEREQKKDLHSEKEMCTYD